MRRLLTGTLLAAAMVPFATICAQDFEGVITVRMAGTARDGTPIPDIEYLSRGGKMRVNVRSPMGAIGVIAIPAEKKLFTLLDAQSMYMEAPMSFDMHAGAANATTPAPTITRTGRKEKIAGYECEHIIVAATQGSTDVCMARGLGPFLNASSVFGGGQMLPWQRALVADGAFPLKVTRADGSTQLEVTKIERKPLSDALFAVPDSYTKMEMPAIRR